jgi:hypothetical protein
MSMEGAPRDISRRMLTFYDALFTMQGLRIISKAHSRDRKSFALYTAPVVYSQHPSPYNK